MSTTVNYNGSQIATLTNETKTLNTQGKYLTGNIVITDETTASYSWEEKYNANAYITSDNPNYISIANFSEAFGADETWRVTWGSGGTAYVCETQPDNQGTTYDGYYIGNPGVAGGTDDGSGCPFIAYKRNSSQLVFATNQSAGTIHLTIEKQVESSGSPRAVELYDNTATITSDPDVNYIWINNQPEDISVGDTYRVTWNGTAYTTTAVSDSTLSSQYGNTFGNPGILGGTDDGSNAPFCAFKASWSDNEMIVSTSAAAGDIALKIEKIIQGGGGSNVASQSPTLQNKTVTSNGSVTADSGYDGLGTVTVNVQPNLQSKTATANGTVTADNGYDGLSSVVVNVSGSSKNVQIAQGVNRVATTTYTAVSGQTLTVAETGTYDVYWSGYRSSTSGTSGSQLYIDNTAYGSANTTFSNNGQSVHLTNVSLTKNQVIAVRARARNTSSYMYVSNLTIVQN